MKVIFECEKCGHVFFAGTMVGCTSHEGEFTPEGFRRVYENHLQENGRMMSCPKCIEPTYGPITVEMVAEMLFAAAGGKDLNEISESYYATELRRMARAVIRLLKELNQRKAYDEHFYLTCAKERDTSGTDWSRKLRELATQDK